MENLSNRKPSKKHKSNFVPKVCPREFHSLRCEGKKNHKKNSLLRNQIIYGFSFTHSYAHIFLHNSLCHRFSVIFNPFYPLRGESNYGSLKVLQHNVSRKKDRVGRKRKTYSRCHTINRETFHEKSRKFNKIFIFFDMRRTF